MSQKKGPPATPELPAPAAYCGPAIPGAAKPYTVYRSGVPPALAEAAANNPVLAGLIVPLEKLPEVRNSIQTKTGHFYRLYCLAQAKQKEA